MIRYFMTIPEATQLILQAASLGGGGEIFILDMGEPVRIVDLATDLIALSGLREGEDIEIQFSGIRPGEKLFEELSVADEVAEPTAHAKIFVHRGRAAEMGEIEGAIEQLTQIADGTDAAAIRRLFAQIVPEYQRASHSESQTPPLAETKPTRTRAAPN